MYDSNHDKKVMVSPKLKWAGEVMSKAAPRQLQESPLKEWWKKEQEKKKELKK